MSLSEQSNWTVKRTVDGRTETLCRADALLALRRAMYGLDPFTGDPATATDKRLADENHELPLAA